MPTIGEQISAARKAQGMTQDQLAQAMHVTRASISNWERDTRMPDGETMLRLSQVLQYSFETQAAREAEPEPEQPQAPKARPALNKRLLICAVAIAAVVLCAVLLAPRLFPAKAKTVYTSANGVSYAISDYQTVTPNVPGKAYLSITPELRFEDVGESGYMKFNFVLREENGFPFFIQKIENTIFFKKDLDVYVFNADELRTFELEPDLPAYGTFEYLGGQPARTPSGERNGLGTGLKAVGVDANGEEMTFTAYLPFPQD
ncbi:MAG: helix-turn-helix transcriptional regulator [Clostridia bacterium]|nr:helix-turn-helix transcriptional regulator [Clostridia bacterium]